MQNTLPHRNPNPQAGRYPATGAQMPSLLKAARSGKPASAVAILCKLLAPVLLTACLWSKIWLGTAGAISLCLGALVLMVLAPKVLATPFEHITWARQVGFGEKVWLNRIFIPVPQNLNYRLTTLYLVFWSGTLVALWGAFASLPILSATGLAVAYSAQVTCFGKLIQLYRVMRDKYPLYRFWAASPVNDNNAQAANRRSPARQSA